MGGIHSIKEYAFINTKNKILRQECFLKATESKIKIHHEEPAT
jgi:hypothetical protein